MSDVFGRDFSTVLLVLSGAQHSDFPPPIHIPVSKARDFLLVVFSDDYMKRCENEAIINCLTHLRNEYGE